jgi:hypothetical protein
MTIYKIIQKDYMGAKKEVGYFKKYEKALEEIKKLKEIDRKVGIAPLSYSLEEITVK